MVKRTTTGRRSAYQSPPDNVFKMPKNLIRRVVFGPVNLSLFLNDVVVKGFGPEIVINFIRNKRSFALALTELTEVELLAIKELLMAAFDIAEPIVKERDRIANESRDTEAAFTRSYRMLPSVFIRPGTQSLNGQELLLRPVTTIKENESDRS